MRDLQTGWMLSGVADIDRPCGVKADNFTVCRRRVSPRSARTQRSVRRARRRPGTGRDVHFRVGKEFFDLLEWRGESVAHVASPAGRVFRATSCRQTRVNQFASDRPAPESAHCGPRSERLNLVLRFRRRRVPVPVSVPVFVSAFEVRTLRTRIWTQTTVPILL